jgi:nicotinamidase-related amidase
MSEWLETEQLRRRERLLRSRAALLVVDLQERLLPAMPFGPQLIKNTQILIGAAARLGLPIIVSQQYPKGLGQTVPEITAALEGVDNVHRFDKVTFSAAEPPEFKQLPPALLDGPLMAREQWIVCGMETHVCVYQTVRDLVGPACAVHVPADAVASRTKANWKIGLTLAADVGAVITSTETIVFDLLREAGTDDFKALSRTIK